MSQAGNGIGNQWYWRLVQIITQLRIMVNSNHSTLAISRKIYRRFSILIVIYYCLGEKPEEFVHMSN